MSEPRPQQAEIVTITEAARRLGVSERTIYRRMKSGQLKREKVSDSRLVSVIVSDDNMKELISSNVSEMSDNTVTVSDIELKNLHVELEAKNAQIARLTEVQMELAQTVRQLQENLYELARLVLSQQDSSVPQASEAVAAERQARHNLMTRMQAFFRKSR